MEVKVDCQSDVEGSSVFLRNIVMFYVLVSLLVGHFIVSYKNGVSFLYSSL